MTSVSRKPLSIALEEIAAGKITYVRIERARVERPRTSGARAGSPDGRRPRPGAASCSASAGGIAAYKAVEVCRRLVDAGALRRARADRGRHPLRRGRDLLGPGVRAGPDLALGRAPTRSPTPAWARAPTSCWWRRPPPGFIGDLRRRHLRRPAHGHAAGHPGAGRGVPGHAHRDVGAPRRPRTTWPAPAAGACTSWRPRSAGWPAATRVRPPGRADRHRGRRRRRPQPTGDLGRRAGPRHRRRHPGADRPRALHRQPLVGQAGPRGGRRGRARGARPSSLVTTTGRPPPPPVEVVRVETAAEMEEAVLARSAAADVVVMAAAVADFRPKAAADEKLKKARRRARGRARADDRHPRRPGRRKRPGQVLVGFAAETVRPPDHAAEKLRTKRRRPDGGQRRGRAGAGFEHDTNSVVILDPDGGQECSPHRQAGGGTGRARRRGIRLNPRSDRP